MIQHTNWLSFLLVLLAFSGIIHFICLYLFLNPSLLYGKKMNAFMVNALQMSAAFGMPPTHSREHSLQSRKPDIKQEQSEEEENAHREKRQKGASNKVNISNEQSLVYLQKIEDHLKSNGAFRKQGYTIRELSNETNIPCYLLSLVINQEYGMNFNELINSYRVDYLTGTIIDKGQFESYTLEAIGKMAGFNSRTAFIAAIKKHTGMTPSSFFGRREVETVEYPMFYVPEKMRDVA